MRNIIMVIRCSLLLAFSLCIKCNNSSNDSELGGPYEYFSSFRNIYNESIDISGLPEKEENAPQLFDVLKMSKEQMSHIHPSTGNSLGQILMPDHWNKSQYYCSEKISLVDGIDSFVIYVSNYRNSDIPSLFLINIKGNRLKSVLLLSWFADDSVDYEHKYTMYKDSVFIVYFKDSMVDEVKLFAENQNKASYPALKRYDINSESYRVVAKIIVDEDGYFREL